MDNEGFVLSCVVTLLSGLDDVRARGVLRMQGALAVWVLLLTGQA